MIAVLTLWYGRGCGVVQVLRSCATAVRQAVGSFITRCHAGKIVERCKRREMEQRIYLLIEPRVTDSSWRPCADCKVSTEHLVPMVVL